MMNKELSANLKKAFLKIGFHENKGGDLSINEYDVKSNSSEVDASYLIQNITIEAIFERGDINKKFFNKPSFLISLKQYFAIKEITVTEIENKRHKLELTITQASTVC